MWSIFLALIMRLGMTLLSPKLKTSSSVDISQVLLVTRVCHLIVERSWLFLVFRMIELRCPDGGCSEGSVFCLHRGHLGIISGLSQEEINSVYLPRVHSAPQDTVKPAKDIDIENEQTRVLQGRTRGDILVLCNLTKSYRSVFRRKTTAVHDLSLAIPRGEVSAAVFILFSWEPVNSGCSSVWGSLRRSEIAIKSSLWIPESPTMSQR